MRRGEHVMDRATTAAVAPRAQQVLAEARAAAPNTAGPMQESAPTPTYRQAPRRTLACHLGVHRWEYFARVLWSVIDMGERMKRCTHCGKEKRA